MGEIGVSFMLGVAVAMLVVELGNAWRRQQASERRRQVEHVLARHGMTARVYSPALESGVENNELRLALSSASLFDRVVVGQDGAVIGGLIPTTHDIRQLRLLVAESPGQAR
jgi:hypothetical protein